MSVFSKKPIQTAMMYGQDGKLRTSLNHNNAMKKDVRRFNKALDKHDKDFINYSSMDINSGNISKKNTRYILNRLDIAKDYTNLLSPEEMANSIGHDTAAIAGNKFGTNIGVKAKIAGFFQPFASKMSERFPSWQKASDRIAKTANNGRMPLTADSTAVMKIAFDKKFYNDCRKPNANKEELKAQYTAACDNLKAMSLSDGVDSQKVSNSINHKIYTQMRMDTSIRDIYAGMTTGDIRLINDSPMLDQEGNEIKIKKRVLYNNSETFVDKDGKAIDCFDLDVREPQSMSEIISDYQKNLEALADKCRTDAEFKKLLASPSYQYTENNAKSFVEADCPNDASKFKYDFSRANIESCKRWAKSKNIGEPYSSLTVPLSYDVMMQGNTFVEEYSIDSYEDMPNINENAKEDVASMPNDEDLGESLKSDVVAENENISDIDKIKAEIEELEILKEQEQARAEYLMEIRELELQRDNLKAEVEALKASNSTGIAAEPTDIKNSEHESSESDIIKAVYPDKLLVDDITIESLSQKARATREGVSIDAIFEAVENGEGLDSVFDTDVDEDFDEDFGEDEYEYFDERTVDIDSFDDENFDEDKYFDNIEDSLYYVEDNIEDVDYDTDVSEDFDTDYDYDEDYDEDFDEPMFDIDSIEDDVEEFDEPMLEGFDDNIEDDVVTSGVVENTSVKSSVKYANVFDNEPISKDENEIELN